MTRKGRGLSEEERALWDTVTRAIAPLRRRKAKTEKPEAKTEPTKTEPIRVAAKPARKAVAAPVVAPSRPAAPPFVPLGRRMRQKLARGLKPIDARIDLHGMTQDRAHAALAHFLRRAQHNGARVVLVITGKGARGTDPHAERGVLKRQVPLWLESAELRALVIGVESASVGHGGDGALYVRIRKTRSAEER
jgi:DNA-nicking Smr family endonuclease